MKFTILFLLTAIRVAAQNPGDQKTVIAIRFDHMQQVIFNMLATDHSSTNLEFRNPTRTDTIISKQVYGQKPLHIFYANVEVNQVSKKFTTTQRSLLIFPGDSVLLDKNGRNMIYSSSCTQFVDDIMDLSELYNSNLLEIKQRIESVGLPAVIKQIEKNYEDNEKKIAQYSAKPEIAAGLHNLNYLIKAKSIGIIPKVQSKILDSCYADIVKNIAKIEAIQSPFTYGILYNIALYRAGNSSNNFWDYFTAVDPEIFSSPFYRSFLLNRLFADYNGNIDQLKDHVSRIKKAGLDDPRYDSVVQSKIALRENKTMIAVATMIDIKGNTLNYFDFVQSQKGSYLLIDFWASWCGPCRMQMPYLRKIKPGLAGKNIKFVSISIDENDKTDDWIAASKDEGVYENLYNFRLDQGSYNKLLKMLEIKSVPRYFLYDPQGKLITADFITPDKKDFKERLLKAISP